jgi:histidine triad (HIT) family protein
MADCLFCKIAEKKIPAKIVHEDEDTVAFEDLSPQASTHVLVIPRKHIATMNDLAAAGADDLALVGRLYQTGARIAAKRGLSEPGWRAVMNCNADAGQTVFHIHLHVLGGRRFGWPPG